MMARMVGLDMSMAPANMKGMLGRLEMSPPTVASLWKSLADAESPRNWAAKSSETPPLVMLMPTAPVSMSRAMASMTSWTACIPFSILGLPPPAAANMPICSFIPENCSTSIELSGVRLLMRTMSAESAKEALVPRAVL